MSITIPDPGPANVDFEQPAGGERLARVAEALAIRGFVPQIAEDADDARRRVFELIPEGAEVHSALSETLRELGIAQIIEESGRYESVRAKLNQLDRETQGREMRKLASAPDHIVGSAHAITDDGIILIGSGTGSQLGAYAYAAGNVVIVVGHQKLVRDLEEGRRRLVTYALPREHLRMQEIGYPGSLIGKTLTLEADFGGRVNVILVPETLGF
jgi:hypothetical protein